MGKKRDRRESEDPQAPSFTFGDLLKAKGISISSEDLPEGPEIPKTTEQAAAPTRTPAGFGRNLRLRVEKKGRGGKVVTILEGLPIQGAELQALSKRIRKALGAGAKVEGEQVVVQGDLRDRLAKWLEKEGAEKVRIL